jgi:RNA polymerase sigma factor (sigma-70 family)
MTVTAAIGGAPAATLSAQATDTESETIAATRDDLASVVAAAAAGTTSAWEDLTRRFGKLVASIARNCRLSDADVAEVSQTTWLRLVENIDRIERPERVGAWLATTARRESLRLVRGNARVGSDPEILAQMADPNARSLDYELLANERSDVVRLAYAKLPERCQRLLGVLGSANPPSYQEVSLLLDMPIGSIGPTRGRCLDHLRKLMLEVDPEP